MAIRISTTHIWTKLFLPIIWISRILTIGIVISVLEEISPDNLTITCIIALISTFVLHALYNHKICQHSYAKVVQKLMTGYKNQVDLYKLNNLWIRYDSGRVRAVMYRNRLPQNTAKAV